MPHNDYFCMSKSLKTYLAMKSPIRTLAAALSIAAVIITASCTKEEQMPQTPVDYFRPIAAFSYDTKVTGNSLLVTFTNQSSNAHTYEWNFGDNNTSPSPNTTHLYPIPASKPRLYTVVLTATDTLNKLISRSSRILSIEPLQTK